MSSKGKKLNWKSMKFQRRSQFPGFSRAFSRAPMKFCRIWSHQNGPPRHSDRFVRPFCCVSTQERKMSSLSLDNIHTSFITKDDAKLTLKVRSWTGNDCSLRDQRLPVPPKLENQTKTERKKELIWHSSFYCLSKQPKVQGKARI